VRPTFHPQVPLYARRPRSIWVYICLLIFGTPLQVVGGASGGSAVAKPTVSREMLVSEVFAGFAYAEAPAATGTGRGTSTTTSTTTNTTGTTGTTKPHKAAAAKRFKGEVASVDATAKSFVVHAKKGVDVTLKVNEKTKFVKGRTWDDIKVGASVSGSYKNDGTENFATSVHLTRDVGGGDGNDWTCPQTGTCPCEKEGVCSKECCPHG
jgi:hypothetical protein